MTLLSEKRDETEKKKQIKSEENKDSVDLLIYKDQLLTSLYIIRPSKSNITLLIIDIVSLPQHNYKRIIEI